MGTQENAAMEKRAQRLTRQIFAMTSFEAKNGQTEKLVMKECLGVTE